MSKVHFIPENSDKGFDAWRCGAKAYSDTKGTKDPLEVTCEDCLDLMVKSENEKVKVAIAEVPKNLKKKKRKK